MTPPNKTFTPRALLLTAFFIIGIPSLPLLLSRRWAWWEAWVYAAINVLGFVVSRALAARRHPDLLAERARFVSHDDAMEWDKVLSPLVGLGGGMIPLVVGLDALFSWSPSFGLAVKITALVVLLAGYVVASYALIENRFFSGVVRIQTDRGHKVISSGPYAWVRNPGYSGALLTYFATPFFLDSYWAFLPVAFITIALIVRTNLEDRTLQEQLEGYREYTEKVRYRLIPGVW